MANKVGAPQSLCCPECGSQKTWKAGTRETAFGNVQRHLCRECGYRFSENSFKQSQTNKDRQICALKVKNLEPQTETKTVAGEEKQTTKGKIIEFVWKLQNEGYRPPTIKSYSAIMKRLLKLGADILNGESVKEAIARQSWEENTKVLVVAAYQKFTELVLNTTWKPPKYTHQDKIAYVPTTEDVNTLIAASGKKLAAFLTIAKETGARCGEIIRLEWTDIDFQRRTVRIQAEKNSKPRILPISNQLTAMVGRLPRVSKRVFSEKLATMHNNLQVTRKRLAHKLNNPRLLKTSFHSIRHLKGTTEYHKTRDLLHVQSVLGHRSVKSTMLYINLEAALYHNSNDDDFHVKVAETLNEACKLLETGFEYVTDMEGKKLFRKRK